MKRYLLDTNACIAIMKNNIKVLNRILKEGTPIGPYDLQIAAIATSHNLILVTHNTREFARIPNLQLEDWEE